MISEEFNDLLHEINDNCLAILDNRNGKYSSTDDRLHNFNAGAEIFGGTPAEACWGYLTKHLTALRDMVKNDDFRDREDFLEKCTDCINYIRLLWCIGNERRKEYTSECAVEYYYEKENS